MKVVLFLLFLNLGSLAYAQDTQMMEQIFSIDASSFVLVKGKTNVNSFQCRINTPIPDSTLVVQYWMRQGAVGFKKSIIKIPVSIFDCGNKWITKDFVKMLTHQGDDHVLIELKEINFKNKENITANFKIVMAGVSNAYTMDITIDNTPKDFTIEGEKEMKLTDFKLDPPAKMAGVVKVKNEVDVSFSLQFNRK